MTNIQKYYSFFKIINPTNFNLKWLYLTDKFVEIKKEWAQIRNLKSKFESYVRACLIPWINAESIDYFNLQSSYIVINFIVQEYCVCDLPSGPSMSRAPPNKIAKIFTGFFQHSL